MADPANTFKTHWATMKTLRGKKKAEFIWEYYKLHIFVGLIAIAVLAYGINSIVHPAKKNFVGVSFYGVLVPIETCDEIRDVLNDALLNEVFDDEKDVSRHTAVVDSYDVDSPDGSVAMAMTQKFVANMMISEIDIIIAPSSFLEKLEMQGVIGDGADIYRAGEKFLARFEINPNYDWRVFITAGAGHKGAAEKALEFIRR